MSKKFTRRTKPGPVALDKAMDAQFDLHSQGDKAREVKEGKRSPGRPPGRGINKPNDSVVRLPKRLVRSSNNTGKLKGINRRALGKDRPSLLHMMVIDAYFRNGYNKSKALRECGYSESTVRNSVGSVFKRPDVMYEIDRRRKQMHAKYAVTEERIVSELAKIGFANVGDYIKYDKEGAVESTIAETDYDQLAALAGIEVEEVKTKGNSFTPPKVVRKIKLHDKMGALTALARINGMFVDKVQVSSDMDEVDILTRGRRRLNAPDVVDAAYEEVEKKKDMAEIEGGG